MHLQPDLDFLAPEYLLSNKNSVTSAADVFSLGVLICWICAGWYILEIHFIFPPSSIYHF
uniref:Protein kinase domain-containing protein n=1 Tax=Elaeophora elaphi TaxID=1147741 RepID=A0A0R3RNT0_9BILA